MKTVRWSVQAAALDFGINRKTLAGRLGRQGIQPGEDGRFSTRDICAAIYDEFHRERARKMKEDADGAELATAKTRSTLINPRDFARRYEPIRIAMRDRIMRSALSETVKAALMDDIEQLRTFHKYAG